MSKIRKWAWQQIPSPVISELLARSSNNVEGVVLDTEHAAFNDEVLYSCIQVVSLTKRLPVVRLAEANLAKVRMCLDAGARGLIFSTVESAGQALDIFKKTHYPHHRAPGVIGARGLGLTRDNRWGLDSLVTPPPILVAQIETTRGVNNIKSIVQLNIFDYYMIGPYDLSSSLGDPGNFESQYFKDAIERVKCAVPDHKLAVHIPNNVQDQLNKYESFGIMALGMDTTFMLEKTCEIFDHD